MKKIICVGSQKAADKWRPECKKHKWPMMHSANGLLNLLDEMEEYLGYEPDEIVLADCDWKLPESLFRDYTVKHEAPEIMLIAEIGGKAGAEEMLLYAIKAGYKYVKLQTVIPEESYTPDCPSYEKFKQLWIPVEKLKRMKKTADDAGVTLFSTPGGIEALRTCVDLGFPIIKVSSGLLTHLPYLQAVSDTGLPVILSTGMATIDEIKIALNRIKTKDVTIMHCTSLYPPMDNEVNISAIATLKKTFPGYQIGYSDHTIWSTSAVMAVALGATVIEKHWSTPYHMSDFRHNVITAANMKGNGIKEPCQRELDIISTTRRFAVATRDIKSGQIIYSCAYKRTGKPKKDMLTPYADISGFYAVKDIARHEPISWEDVE